MGNDSIQGMDGNDIINGGPGNDLISGGNGDDLIYFGLGSGVDTIDGGPGFDTIVFTGGITLNDLTITPTGPTSFDIAVGPNGDKIIASNIEQLTFSAVEPAPEPITMFLGGTGLISLAYAGRRRLFGR